MINTFQKALDKVIQALNSQKINYMIVGGFAVSFHNRARTTNDIDIVLQIHSSHIKAILEYFPEWKDFEFSFKENVKYGRMFNITDFETGIRYDFMTYKDSEYNWIAFERRKKIDFFGVECFICSKEDLVISKLQWYAISPSDKQLEDIKFLLLDDSLDKNYLTAWIKKLKLNTYGVLE